jgi:hypothetical protein
MQSEIVVALITSVIGGSLVAIVNHLLTRRKYDAETRKLDAEIEKLKAETEKIRNETRHELNEAKYYDSPTTNERIIYDGTKGIAGYDIHSIFSACDIQKGVMVIQVEKWDWGRFELQSYTYDGKSCPYIPKDETISGLRRFHVSYEVKAIGASYEVSAFLWETPEVEDEPSIDDRNVNVTNSEWKQVHFYFKAPPNKNYTVNVGAQHISGEGSLQIKNLMVTERID